MATDSQKVPVEITTRYATSVDSLTEAWEFVMARVDLVGPHPSIHISPCWHINPFDENPDEAEPHFSVVVEGMVPEGD